ncbi:MAG: putative metal-dependent hydrolase [Parcubacteria bacterium C7867-002]|nr:MAG: putative metal-dependent hydrolase [Parcubacteria bacterium C7867-002]
MIPYTLRRSIRTRTVRITIRRTGDVVVSAPIGVPQIFITAYLARMQQWIASKLLLIKERAPDTRVSRLPGGRRDFVAHKDEALRILSERTKELNQAYQFSYTKIVVRNQKTRWGSCSRHGVINFNYRLAYMPDDVRDYVIVHELCHLKQFNHSRAFWDLVKQAVPNYKEVKKKLKGLTVG